MTNVLLYGKDWFFGTFLNSFMLERGSATQQKCAWDTIFVICGSHIVLACCALIGELLLNVPSFYGRFVDARQFSLPAKIAWVLQELPSFAISSYFLINSFNYDFQTIPAANRILLAMFVAHYFNRTFIYGFRIRGGKPTNLLPFFMAGYVTALNGLLQGLCLTYYDGYRIVGQNMRMAFGCGLFVYGMYVNLQSDQILQNLRKPGEKGYKIPVGGYFDYVTQANYFGECVEWLGYAIAGHNHGGYVFALLTFSNLFARAYKSHQWYHKKFDNYPKNRRILIPFLL